MDELDQEEYNSNDYLTSEGGSPPDSPEAPIQYGIENHQIVWSDFDSRISIIFDHLNRYTSRPKLKLGIVIFEGFPAYFEDQIGKITESISYVSIPHFPLNPSGDNEGKLLFSSIEGCNVMIFSENIDYFDEYEIFMCKLIKKMGCKHLLTFGVATAMDYSKLHHGDFMVTKDHVNLPGLLCPPTNPSKLCHPYPFNWKNTEKVYNERHRKLALEVPDTVNIKDMKFKEGVYISTKGPNYLTRAEVFMMLDWKVDAMGKDSLSLVTTAVQENLIVASYYMIIEVPVKLPENLKNRPNITKKNKSFMKWINCYFSNLRLIDDINF